MIRRSRKAIIIGGGIAGPATAMFLRSAGFESQIFEARPRAAGIGGGLQIAPNGMHVLDELGLADEMVRIGSVAESMLFTNQSGRFLGSINRDMRERFGQPAVNVARAALSDAILAQVRWAGIEVSFGKRLVRIEDLPDRPIAAHFEDGTMAEGDLLIGADGVHSSVRAHVNPGGPVPFDTGLVGFGGFIPRSVLEKAGVGPHVMMTLGQRGSFGYGYCSSIEDNGAMWWDTQSSGGKDASAFRAMSQEQLKQHIRAFHAGWHDPIPQIIDHARDIIVTDTLDIATLPQWSRGRVVLIGDAAHATTPHAGQGASIALEDALRLSRLLRRGEEFGVTFAKFEAERRPRAERIVAAARRNGGSKGDMSRAGALMRDIAIKLLLPVFARGQDWMYQYNPRVR